MVIHHEKRCAFQTRASALSNNIKASVITLLS